MTEAEVIARWVPILRVITFGLPIVLYLLNHFALRLRFRILAPLSVALTGLVHVWVKTAHALPQLDVAMERAGRVEDTDSHILGAMISAPILGVIGTLPVLVVHLLRKWIAGRRARGAEAGFGG